MTIHGDETENGVRAYDLPKKENKWMNANNYKEHTLVSNFHACGANGEKKAHAPGTVYARGKTLFLAGSGADGAYMLEPKKNDYKYKKTKFAEVGGTVHSLAFGDFDGEEFVLVPSYEDNLIHAYSLE